MLITFFFTDMVDRAVSTSIYYLLPSGDISLLHRIPCAETWHFYLGEPLTVTALFERFLYNATSHFWPASFFALYKCIDDCINITVKQAWYSNKINFLSYLCFVFKVLESQEEDRSVKLITLGTKFEENQRPQYTVSPNVWFGAFPANDHVISADGAVIKNGVRDSESHYSLVGCTCAPAFQLEDFELANRIDLVTKYPDSEALISCSLRSEENVFYYTRSSANFSNTVTW